MRVFSITVNDSLVLKDNSVPSYPGSVKAKNLNADDGAGFNENINVIESPGFLRISPTGVTVKVTALAFVGIKVAQAVIAKLIDTI
jgi:hypothetical protein